MNKYWLIPRCDDPKESLWRIYNHIHIRLRVLQPSQVYIYISNIIPVCWISNDECWLISKFDTPKRYYNGCTLDVRWSLSNRTKLSYPNSQHRDVICNLKEFTIICYSNFQSILLNFAVKFLMQLYYLFSF